MNWFFKFYILKKSDEFDKKFGFILKYRIDTKKNYLRTKSHYFQCLKLYQKRTS